MRHSLPDKNRAVSLLSVVVLLLIWGAVSAAAGSDNLLPGPWKTLSSTLGVLCDPSFFSVVAGTFLRALAGFSIALAAGVLLGVAGGMNGTVHSFLKPWVVLMRSVPVIAFALLAIIWTSPSAVPVFTGVLTMFPIVYVNVSEGIRNVDAGIVQMAVFYGVKRGGLVREVYFPAVRPFVVSGVCTAVGMGWRAIIVGEVLSQPQWGIGSVMHSAQVFLRVDILIAWTFVTVVFGAVFERLCILFLKK